MFFSIPQVCSGGFAVGDGIFRVNQQDRERFGIVFQRPAEVVIRFVAAAGCDDLGSWLIAQDFSKEIAERLPTRRCGMALGIGATASTYTQTLTSACPQVAPWSRVLQDCILSAKLKVGACRAF